MFPKELVVFLMENGHEAVSTRRLGLGGSTDHSIWREAERTEAVIISKDSDFHSLVARGLRSRLLHVRAGNQTKIEVIKLFSEKLPAIKSAFEDGERIVELG